MNRDRFSGAGRFPRYLFFATKFLIFFALIAFVVTCSFLLFLDSMRLDPDILRENALLTFLNILLLSALFTVIDGIRRRLTVERPVRRIRAATQRIIQGDFSVRIEPLHGPERADAFDAIIEDFNQMARELSGVETLRTDFIANVSHELKTPLAVIQNYGSLLQDPALPKEQRVEYAKAVTDASRRLADLIANILKLNKLENQQIFPQAETYDLGEQLRECLLGFEDAWEAKELAVEADIPDGVAVRTDRELLTLVWNNLFSNAVKFTDAGGSIHVSLRHTGTQAEVCVTDTGCGMSPETGRHIFEKFYQGDSSHATQGNGLGLAPLLRRLLFPGGGGAALAVFAAVASLWTVFSNGWEDAPAARAAYAFSAYALVVAICRAVPAARRAKTAVYGLPPVRRWRADAALRALVSLRAGLCVNLCFAACKLYAGIRFRSPWFGAAAVYYTVLSTMRFAVLRGVRNAPPAGPSAAPVRQMRGLRVYRRCGVLMFALNLAMTAIAAQMVWQNRAYRYPGTLIYASAAYTFYCFGSAAASAVKAHRMHDPVHAAAKMLGLAGALMSVLTLQTAMLAQFGGDAAMRRTMNAVTGACVCSLVFCMAVFMAVRGNILLRRAARQNAAASAAPPSIHF